MGISLNLYRTSLLMSINVEMGDVKVQPGIVKYSDSYSYKATIKILFIMHPGRENPEIENLNRVCCISHFIRHKMLYEQQHRFQRHIVLPINTGCYKKRG